MGLLSFFTLRRYSLLVPIVFFLSGWIHVHGQSPADQKKEDSLKAELTKITNRNEIPAVYLEMSRIFSLSKPNKSIEYLLQAKSFARNLSDDSLYVLILSSLGLAYINIDQYQQAEEALQEALNLLGKNRLGWLKGDILNRLGLIATRRGQNARALDFYLSALAIAETAEDTLLVAKLSNNLAILYRKAKNCDKALEYYHRALLLYESKDDKRNAAGTLNNIGVLYKDMDSLKNAEVYYLRSLRLKEEIHDEKGVYSTYNNLSLLYNSLGEYHKALEYSLSVIDYRLKENDKYGCVYTWLSIVNSYLAIGQQDSVWKYLEQAGKLADEIGLDEVKSIIAKNYFEYYFIKKNYKDALEHFREFYSLDSMYNSSLTEKLAEYEMKEKEKENVILKQENEIQHLQLSRSRVLRNFSYAGMLVGILVSVLIYNRYRLKKQSMEKLAAAHEIIQIEKAKSEKLLLNILPISIVNDLKEKGKTIPKKFENITVYFSDIVGFTKISSQLDPAYLIDELNDIFTAFDTIIEKHRGERIKTIGDAYMAVCGMDGDENASAHAESIMMAAWEIIEYLKNRNKISKIEWKIRVGVHTGPVVGGVVGIKKYIYDLFGDTINTAARMETYSLPMKINVSETTYRLLDGRFDFEERNMIEVKGKGVLKMYFVKNVRPGLETSAEDEDFGGGA